MKRIYPGRRPSKMGFAGSIFSIAFGILWTILAFTMTRGLGVIGVVFPLFGVLFVGLGIVQSVYHYKNAAGRRASLFDVSDDQAQAGPHDAQAGPHDAQAQQDGVRYCGYCGQRLQSDMLYCTKCGRKQDGVAQ